MKTPIGMVLLVTAVGSAAVVELSLLILWAVGWYDASLNWVAFWLWASAAAIIVIDISFGEQLAGPDLDREADESEATCPSCNGECGFMLFVPTYAYFLPCQKCAGKGVLMNGPPEL